jgi:hypothetical protein
MSLAAFAAMGGLSQMKSLVVVVGIVALTCACGGSRNSTDTAQNQNPAPAAPQAGTTPAVDARVSGSSTVNPTSQQITLVGCLQGPAGDANAVGTSGRRDRSTPPAGIDTDRDAVNGGAFRLVDATPASNDTAGTGTAGAGASGGPLVSGRASYVLDGIPNDARGSVNKQVRVTGRLDATAPPASSGTSNSGAAASGAGSGAGSATGTGPGVSGSTANPAGAGNATNGARRVAVERVEVVSQACAKR